MNRIIPESEAERVFARAGAVGDDRVCRGLAEEGQRKCERDDGGDGKYLHDGIVTAAQRVHEDKQQGRREEHHDKAHMVGSKQQGTRQAGGAVHLPPLDLWKDADVPERDGNQVGQDVHAEDAAKEEQPQTSLAKWLWRRGHVLEVEEEHGQNAQQGIDRACDQQRARVSMRHPAHLRAQAIPVVVVAHGRRLTMKGEEGIAWRDAVPERGLDQWQAYLPIGAKDRFIDTVAET